MTIKPYYITARRIARARGWSQAPGRVMLIGATAVGNSDDLRRRRIGVIERRPHPRRRGLWAGTMSPGSGLLRAGEARAGARLDQSERNADLATDRNSWARIW